MPDLNYDADGKIKRTMYGANYNKDGSVKNAGIPFPRPPKKAADGEVPKELREFFEHIRNRNPGAGNLGVIGPLRDEWSRLRAKLAPEWRAFGDEKVNELMRV